jgi:hypothetical protein
MPSGEQWASDWVRPRTLDALAGVGTSQITLPVGSMEGSQIVGSWCTSGLVELRQLLRELRVSLMIVDQQARALRSALRGSLCLPGGPPTTTSSRPATVSTNGQRVWQHVAVWSTPKLSAHPCCVIYANYITTRATTCSREPFRPRYLGRKPLSAGQLALQTFAVSR